MLKYCNMVRYHTTWRTWKCSEDATGPIGQ